MLINITAITTYFFHEYYFYNDYRLIFSGAIITKISITPILKSITINNTLTTIDIIFLIFLL